MRNLNGIENLDHQFLYATLVLYRADIAANVFPAGRFASASKAKAFAEQTCTEIVKTLARSGFEPGNKVSPRCESGTGATSSRSRS